YRRFRNIFEPKGKVGNVALDPLREKLRFFARPGRSGFKTAALNEGLDTGPYQIPKGPNYGGRQPAEQTRFLRAAAGPVLARHWRKTLYLDYHTGLGDNGVLSIILGKHPASGPLTELTQMFGARKSDGIEITTGQTKGFFPTEGDVIDFVPSLSGDPDR